MKELSIKRKRADWKARTGSAGAAQGDDGGTMAQVWVTGGKISESDRLTGAAGNEANHGKIKIQRAIPLLWLQMLHSPKNARNAASPGHVPKVSCPPVDGKIKIFL